MYQSLNSRKFNRLFSNLIFFILSRIKPQKKLKNDMTINNPDKITTPSPLYNSDPEPGKRASGSSPNVVVRVVMKIGLILSLTAFIADSLMLLDPDL